MQVFAKFLNSSFGHSKREEESGINRYSGGGIQLQEINKAWAVLGWELDSV